MIVRFLRRYMLLFLSIIYLITSSSGNELSEGLTAFPTGFLLKYLEVRSMCRAIVLTNLQNGVFMLDHIIMKEVIKAASSRFIHLQILPFEKKDNRTTSESNWPIYSTLSLMSSPLMVVIYDGSSVAMDHLRKESLESHFRARYKWLILTNDKKYESLDALLPDLDASVDSDVTIGVANNEGTIQLMDIYILQRAVHANWIGSWKHSNFSEVESEYSNNSISKPFFEVGNLTLKEQVGKWFQRSDFYGFPLRVVTVNVSSFYTLVLLDPVSQLPFIAGGYFGEIFNILSETMNFTHSLNVLEGYAYGVILSISYNVPNWSGVVGELQNKHADVTACEVSAIPQRQMVIDFSMPLQIISRRLYIHRPMRSGAGAGGSKSETTWYKGGGFVRPFALQVWVCVTASILLFLAAARLHAFYTFPHQRNVHEHNDMVKIAVLSKGKKNTKKMSKLKASNEKPPEPSLSSDFFRFTATLVQQGLPDDPDPDEGKGEVNSLQSRRLILWTASVTYLIVYTSYGAKLASILASESEPQPMFTDLKGLLHVPNWKLGFVEKGLGRVSFENAEPDSVMGKLWSDKIEKNLDVLVPNVETGLHRALRGEYAFLGFHTAVQSVLVKSLSAKETEEVAFTKPEVCRLMALPNDYLKGGVGFGFQKESPYRPFFNNWLLLIRSCGLLDRVAKTWLPEALPCLEDQTVATVGLIDIAPALSALLFGIALSITILLLELLYDAYNRRPGQANNVPFQN